MKNFGKTLSKLLVPVFAILVTLPGNAGFAQGAASLRLESNSGTYQHSADFSLTVFADTSGESVNAVEVDLSYPISLLEFTGFDTSGTNFEIEAPDANGSGGTVSLTRATVNSQSGSNLNVITLNFKTRTTNGDANVNFGPSSKLIRTSDTTNVLGGASGGIYTVEGTGSGSSTPPATTNPGSTPTPQTTTPPATDTATTEPSSSESSPDTTTVPREDEVASSAQQSAAENVAQTTSIDPNSEDTTLKVGLASVFLLVLAGSVFGFMSWKKSRDNQGFNTAVAEVGVVGKPSNQQVEIDPSVKPETTVYPDPNNKIDIQDDSESL